MRHNNYMCVVLSVCWLYVCVYVCEHGTVHGPSRPWEATGGRSNLAVLLADQTVSYCNIWIIPRIWPIRQNTTLQAHQAMWHKCLVVPLNWLMSHGKIMVSIQYDSAANLTQQQPMIHHCNSKFDQTAKTMYYDTAGLYLEAAKVVE